MRNTGKILVEIMDSEIMHSVSEVIYNVQGDKGFGYGEQEIMCMQIMHNRDNVHVY